MVAWQECCGEEVGAQRAIRDQRQPSDRGRVDAGGRGQRMVVGDEERVRVVEEVDSGKAIVHRWGANEDDVEVTA